MRFAGRADSIGPTYQDDSERSSRRKANEAETGWSQPAHKLQTRPPRQRSSLREFLCRIWYLCWNLTMVSCALSRVRMRPRVQLDAAIGGRWVINIELDSVGGQTVVFRWGSP